MTIAFFSAFLLVFFRAFQQQNVHKRLYIPAILTSYAIALGDIGIILSGVTYGYDVIIPVGTGGAVGVTLAMFFHKKIFK